MSDEQKPKPLPSPLPAEPWTLARRWFEDAVSAHVQPNPMAMTLACVEPDGRPSARQVICRGFDADAGWLIFYTNRQSPKARALERVPHAALVFHWDHFARQIRIEGPVRQLPDADSDAYFASRPRDAQISAWASDQSESIATREAFLERVAETERRFADGKRPLAVPRPPHWGGYRVWSECVELWVGLPGRSHDRGLWTRKLEREGESFRGGVWQVTRLQP